MPSLPDRDQLVLPLMEIVAANGPVTPSQATRLVADALDLPAEVRDLTVTFPQRGGFRTENALKYNLRWVRQDLVEDDIFDGSLHGLWSFTSKGEAFYVSAQPGVIVSVFENELGRALCGDVRTVLQRVVNGAIQTYITSVAYPILSYRPYGGLSAGEAIAFVDELFRLLRSKLAPDANVFLNLGYVFSGRGTSQSTYVERAVAAIEDQGYFLQQRLFWENPCKPPAGNAVTADRTHLVEKVEPIYRFSPASTARGDTLRIRKAYSESMLRSLACGGDRYGRRPSGHGHLGASFATDNGGAIPGNLFRIPHASSAHPTYRALEARGLEPHPAQMPDALVEPLISFTTNPGELVADLQSGGGGVARVAEHLNRQWLINDIQMQYVANSSIAFEGTPGFRRFIDPQLLKHCFQ